MTSEQLNYFLSVAKHLNFTEAAKDFYITQPAISRQITELERELGAKLFIRNTRNVTLTKSGELFLEDAKRILALGESARERVRIAESNNNEFTLKIAYLPSPCKAFLPDLINRFLKVYPHVTLTLTRHNAQEIIEAMHENPYDLYFSLSLDLEIPRDFLCKHLFTDRFCIICRNDHPCVNSSNIDFDKISTEPFLTFSSKKAPLMAKQILQVCRELHFNPRIAQTFDSMEEILFATESGIGITILPYRIRNYLSSSLTYIPLKPEMGTTLMGVAWNQNTQNPAVEWFLDLLSQMMAEHPELF